jgi:hypothetical protein
MDELDAAHQCISSLDHRTATSRSTDIAPQPTPSLAEVGEKKKSFFFSFAVCLGGWVWGAKWTASNEIYAN